MSPSVIDRTVFGELQATAGSDFVAELVDTFLEEAPAMLAELRSARAANHAERFKRAAHSLKSNSLTFGAMALGQMARALELAGLNADEQCDAVALDALDAAYSQAADALKAMRHG